MKLVLVIMVTTLLQVQATGFAQNVTLNRKDAPLGALFKEIKKQTGYDFLYNAKTLSNAKSVTINVINEPLPAVLKQCFAGQPLSYSVDEKTIIVKAAAPTIMKTIETLLLRSANIEGRVFDSLGNKLQGASVSLKGTKFNTLTDQNGYFRFTGVPNGSYTLTGSFIGYTRQEKPVTVDGENLTLSIMLHTATSALDAVVVIAYGKESKRFSVGSSTTISAATIERQPVSNVLLALEGQVPGLIVSPTGGAPGSSVQLQVRGQNTLAAQGFQTPFDQPLFIIDGLPFAPQNNNISSGSSLGGNSPYNVTKNNPATGMSPFSNINPADIESITVLKDANATSIYGTQGSHGVILITTKKGKAGKTSLSVNINTNTNFVTRPIQMLNTAQYLHLRNEAVMADGIDLTQQDPSMYPDLLAFDQQKYTNWYKQFFNKIPTSTDAHVSLNGGAQNTNFYISAGATKNKYNFPGDFAESRLTSHAGFHHNSINNRFNLDFGTDFSYDHNNSTTTPSVTTAFLMPPNTPDLLDKSGNLLWNYNGVSLIGYQQYASLKTPADIKSYSLNSTMRLSYKVISGLTVSTNLGYSRFTTNEFNALPLAAQDPNNQVPSTAYFYNTATETINIEPQADYTRTIGKGVLTALAGGTYKKNAATGTNIEGDDYASDALLHSINGAATIYANDNSSIYKYAAVFGRVGYIYDSKYIISLTGRRDGSSNFGAGRQFGNFGSAGAAWIMSEEKGFRERLPFLSFSKISANYGTSGSDGVAPYQYQAFWAPVPSYTAQPFQGIRPYLPLNLYNPDYSWSTKKSLNIAIDLGFFKDRLLVNGTYYRDRTGNQLTSFTLPSQVGFTQVVQNFDATVQNKGWEFTVNTTNIKQKDFSWTSNLLFSATANKLLAFPGLSTSPYANRYVLGKSVNTVIGYKYKGVNPETGLYEFYAADGSATSSPQPANGASHGDWQPIATLTPKFTGGLGNTISYKGMSLYFFFQFAKQTGMNYLGGLYQQGIFPGTLNNVPVQTLDYWKKPGEISNIQRITSGNNFDALRAASNFFQSSGAYSDASYIRLKTLSLDYQLPEKSLKALGVSNCRVFIRTQNLLTITGYKVGDPETPGSLLVFPLQRTLSCGLTLNL